jgi:hypothetical protein
MIVRIYVRPRVVNGSAIMEVVTIEGAHGVEGTERAGREVLLVRHLTGEMTLPLRGSFAYEVES